MNRYSKLFFYISICVFLSFSCRQGKNSAEIQETPTPELILKSLTFNGKLLDISNLKDIKATVPNDKETVATKDVEAIFNIANVVFSVKDEPVALEAGKETLITIVVPALKGKYKAYEDIKLKVTREEKDDPLPNLQSMTIHGKAVVNKEVTVPNDKETVATKDVEAIFNISDVVFSVKDEPVALEAGKKTLITISVDAVKGKHKALEIEVGVTREEKEDAKLEVKLIEVKGGTAGWGDDYDYGIYYQLTYKPETKYWEGNKPDNNDVLAFKMKLDKKDVDENKITARLFEGSIKGPTILYETEKTKAPVSGTLKDSLLVFEFDDKNCTQLSIKTYYKIEIFIDGNSQISALIKLRD